MLALNVALEVLQITLVRAAPYSKQTARNLNVFLFITATECPK